jgi:hypothetical protein
LPRLELFSLDPRRTQVRILRRTARLVDLMLVIQAQGKHSCGVAIPDRFIGVDDMNAPLSTPVI